MWTLGIETATLHGSVALVRDSEITEEIRFDRGMVHGQVLVPAIQRLLRSHGLRVNQLDLVACDIGPGSYTGLRVGIATAKGLCRFSGTAIIGVCSLDAMAEEYARTHPALHPVKILCPVLDAKWGQVYYGFYKPNGERIDGPFVGPPEVPGRGPAAPLLFGDATTTFRRELERSRADIDPAPGHHRPRASRVAFRGALDARTGRTDTVEGLRPLYLRPTEAELTGGREDRS